MKKTFAMILSALLLCGTVSPVFAEEAVTALGEEDIVNLGMIADEYLKGPHEMWSGPYDNEGPGYPEYGFDGDWSTTINYKVEGGDEWWFGVRFDQPTILTEVVFVAPDWQGDGIPDRKHCLHGCTLEGSNDGENWEFIIELGDVYAEFEDYMLDFEDGLFLTYTEAAFDGGTDYYGDEDPEDPVAYTYYRVYNNYKGGAEWGDVELWGYFVEEEPEQPDYLIGDVDLDGVVDINDAMYLFQYSMLPELFTMEYQGNLDLDFDELIDINDAMYLFQYSMLPEMFPIEW